MTAMRHGWLRLHRWFALSLGWVLVLSGLTGAILVLAQPLDRWLNPTLFRARSADATTTAPPVTLQTIQQSLRTEFGPKASFTLRPPRETGETLRVLVRGAWDGTLYLDPVNGTEQGRRGETEGFVNTLFKLHSSLMLQDTGKALLAWVALIYLLLLITGIILWWPRRWPPSFKLVLNKGTLRALFDLHRIGGISLGFLITISVTTGGYMAWRPIGGFITTLSGAETVKPPEVKPIAHSNAHTAPDLDSMVTQARALYANAPTGYIQLPAHPNRPLRIRLMLPDDPHPNGLTSVWLHPQSGEILASHRWDELDPGARAVAVIYPLHIGVLGGTWHEVLTLLSGLSLSGLGFSGIWLWWRRRQLRKAV